jgi:hypothetical protein
VLVVGMMTVVASAQRWGRGENRGGPQHQAQQSTQSGQRQQSQQQDRQSQRAQSKGSFSGRPAPNQGATPAQPRHGDWLRKHGDLPPAEQQKALENDPAFRALAPQDQQRLRQRLQWFNSLSPDRRERVLRRHEIIEKMTPEQRARARDLFQQFRNLPEARQKTMEFYFRNLHNMSPEDRQRVMDSPQFRSQFSDEEQNIMRGMTDLNIGPAHAGEPSEGAPPED